jgi:pantothenate kinase type III
VIAATLPKAATIDIGNSDITFLINEFANAPKSRHFSSREQYRQEADKLGD